MTYLDFQVINSLTEMFLVGGTETLLEFDVYDDSGSPINLTSATCTWAMSYYGQPNYAVLSKPGIKSGTVNYRFSVILTANDTLHLSGKFVHQPIVQNDSGSIYRPAQGLITIIPAIQES